MGELQLRGVDYSKCIGGKSRGDIDTARASGRANPYILNKFNKQRPEESFSREAKVDIKDEDMDNVLSNDGALPGGMKPETLKKMIGNPEVMAMLQKGQDAGSHETHDGWWRKRFGNGFE